MSTFSEYSQSQLPSKESTDGPTFASLILKHMRICIEWTVCAASNSPDGCVELKSEDKDESAVNYRTLSLTSNGDFTQTAYVS